ncbi:MAG: aldose 1-epimerase family protein [Anaerolineae bacterium]|jgi:hypothetical protein|nr:aldose 1-epimerase family protein [Anaerolineae bacterium]
MPTLFDRQWTRDELRQFTGHMNQLAGIRAVEYADGRSAALKAFHVWTGTGLTFDVLVDRCLDIGPCYFQGKSLTWHSAGGFAHPSYYEPEGLRWLRTFGGGLFATCGLDQYASPTVDNGEEFGLHGRAGNLPAEQTGYRCYWDGDDYRLEITGQVRQARLFGENLLLRRRISTKLGSNAIQLDDEVINEGWQRQPHMMMYHFNLGFPLVSPATELTLPAKKVTPRTPLAAQHLDTQTQLLAPTKGWSEHVFIMDVEPAADGYATAAITNRDTGLRAEIRFRADTLPYLVQWKQMGQGDYVLGVEPVNSSAMEGRVDARNKGVLVELEPGESRTYSITFSVERI